MSSISQDRKFDQINMTTTKKLEKWYKENEK
jgi:hypothetical protein